MGLAKVKQMKFSIVKNKKIVSWALYDWANSAFSTTVMAGFFPLFFKNFWSSGADPILTTAKLGTTISVSSFLIAILSPTLGVMADLKGYKKLFCGFFMLVGVFCCLWMSQIAKGDWFSAMIAYGLAMMAFNASCVFYDALLPSIARGTQLDYASSLGYALGYLGGGLLFLINVLMFLKPNLFALPDGVSAVQWSFATVAVWWLLFSIPLFKNVPEPTTVVDPMQLWRLTIKSVATLQKTFLDLLQHRNILIYMISFWLYIDGVYTVITMAVDYGLSIGLESRDLIAALLITQFIGFPFAWAFGFVTKRFGCRLPILFCIGVYSITVLLATQMSTALHFYLLATVIGVVQGGVQSLSRSLFAHMIPENKSGEYFGFFNVVGKFASILGPLLVSFGAYVTGNVRFGMAGLLVLFITGGVLLFFVKEPRFD